MDRDRAGWQLFLAVLTAVISVLTAAGVLWNAIQIGDVNRKVDELRSTVDELRGKVDTIETILEGHVNTPHLRSELPSPEPDLAAAR